MKFNRKQYVMSILILLIGLAGWYYLFGSAGAQLKNKLNEFNKAQTEALDVVRRNERKASSEFEKKFNEVMGKMKTASNEFLSIATKTKNKELKEDATNCHKGMVKILNAYEDYNAAQQRYLMFKDSVVQRFAEQAKKGKEEAYKKFKKERNAGQRLIDKSGL